VDAPSTSPDAYDSASKSKEDVIFAVNEPVKRSYDEAFDDDHSEKYEV
jgi:hypothetical protein